MTVSTYIEPEDLRSYLGINTDSEDLSIQNAINAAGRAIDNDCGRFFYKDETNLTRRYLIQDLFGIDSDDIADVTSLVVETSWDLVTYITVQPSIYHAAPLNALVEHAEPWPYTAIIGNVLWPRPVPVFIGAWAQVTATAWGWPEVPEAIRQATLILAARVYKRANSPMGVESFSDYSRRVLSQDPDLQALIGDYKRFTKTDSFS